MYITHIENLDLYRLAASGQTFRVKQDKDTYRFITGKHAVDVREIGYNKFMFDCTVKEFDEIWTPYFSLDDDFNSIGNEVPADDNYMQAAAKYGCCVPIIRQDLWETVCSFIISQNNNIPRIKSSIDKLCAKYGRAFTYNDEWQLAFPYPETLAELDLWELNDIGLGYRDKYVLSLAKDIASGKIDLTAISNMDDAAALVALKSIYGIGDKVANCIMLYGLHRLDAFPVDTHIKQILLREYDGAEYRGLDKKQKLQRIIQDHINIYSGHRGVVQQYMFDYETRQQVN